MISVEFPGRQYPSKNRELATSDAGGAKSAIYTWLTRATKKAAIEAMTIAEWTMANSPCFFMITLIVPNRQRRDALNLGTAEANALTKVGVWSDDTLALPAIKNIVVDPRTPMRVVMLVQKLYEPLHVIGVSKTVKQPKEAKEKPDCIVSDVRGAKRRAKSPGSILGVSKPRPLAEALAAINKAGR